MFVIRRTYLCTYNKITDGLKNIILLYFLGVQCPGDMYVLRGETLHWVRGMGFSTNFSWNFGKLDNTQLKMSYDR